MFVEKDHKFINIDLSDVYNIAVFGWTRSGKSHFINWLIKNYYDDIDVDNIIIFSPSFKTDSSYEQLRYKMLNAVDGDYNWLKVYDNIDMKLINDLVASQYEDWLIIDKQKYNKINNNMSLSKYVKNIQPIKRYLIIFDDVLGDKKISSFHSGISNYCTKSRHSNIISIYTSQMYTKLPNVVRSQCDIMIIFYLSPFQDIMFNEICEKNKQDRMRLIVDKLIKNGIKYSCIVFDKISNFD